MSIAPSFAGQSFAFEKRCLWHLMCVIAEVTDGEVRERKGPAEAVIQICEDDEVVWELPLKHNATKEEMAEVMTIVNAHYLVAQKIKQLERRRLLNAQSVVAKLTLDEVD